MVIKLQRKKKYAPTYPFKYFLSFVRMNIDIEITNICKEIPAKYCTVTIEFYTRVSCLYKKMFHKNILYCDNIK